MSASDDGVRQQDVNTYDERSALSNEGSSEYPGSSPQQSVQSSTPQSPRPLRIYTRTQLLALHKSPLVAPPPELPELKDWFGLENEQNLNKKDYESTPPNSARERRFRRDADDSGKSSRGLFMSVSLKQPSETPTRPSFRSALTQPSQMGNFKHQSLRDRDGDSRDKEGLRNLSDKFDRGDRLALPLNIRNKDRDSLANNRATSSNPLGSANARRADARESGKKKLEAADDWRRGDSRRTEDRERPRSRVRDSSRSRRDSSTSRRDDRDRDRDRDKRDREDTDDPRRWRDDGRRDDRIAARRDRDKDHKERWPASDDRDPRSKRPSGRDKKLEDGKDREDRRGDREREREKEPAWMDTYIPPATGSAGILGGKTADGELDGIQAFKKNMKEKEQRNAIEETPMSAPARTNGSGEKTLDEIQVFKMLMKQAQTQEGEMPSGIPSDATTTPNGGKAISSVLSALSEGEHSGPREPPYSAPLPAPPGLERSSDHTPPPSASAFQPPPGSRLLALGRGVASKPINLTAGTPPADRTPPSSSAIKRPPQLDLDNPTISLNASEKAAFSPYEERKDFNLSAGEPTRKDRQPLPTAEGNWADPSDTKSSRFAKFFDGKAKDVPTNIIPTPRLQHHGIISPLSAPGQGPSRLEPSAYNPGGEARTMDDLLGMLNTSVQVNRSGQIGPISVSPGSGNNHGASHQSQSQLHMLQQQQQAQLQYIQQQHQQQHQQQPQPSHRMLQQDSFYDGRMDNRNFVPDNLVPGLRSAPPPRNRDGLTYPDPLDDVIHLNSQRLPPHPRGLDPVYPSSALPPFSQQSGRLPAISPIQQYRGGPSPISNQNALNQRLPPGLANLGGRPPHDPAQFSSSLPGMNTGLHGGPPQSYNNLHNVGYNNPPSRGLPPHQVSNALAQQQLAGLNHQNLMDLRSQGGLNQVAANMLNINHLNGGRNMGLGGGYPGPGGQPLHAGMRHQTQQPPPQLAHLGLMAHNHNMTQDAPHSQQSADLMALLLGGRMD